MIKLFFKFIHLMRLPYKNREYLETLQLTKLKNLLNHSKKNVPFYRKKFAGIDLSKIQTLADVKLLPIVNSTELREEEIEVRTDVNIDRRTLLSDGTSGTSGMPLKFYLSRKELSLRQLRLLRFLCLKGLKPWWRWVHIYRETEQRNFSTFQRLINSRRNFVSISLPLEEQARRLIDARPHVITTMKTSLDCISTWMIEHDLKCKGVKLIVTGGELLYSDLEDKLKRVFECAPTDMYGGNDVGPIGYQCPFCHLNFFDQDSYIVEILDDNNKPVKAGERGKAVITVLDQLTTPLIRFDIGDFISRPPKNIHCKNKFAHYVAIEGRESDRLILEDGRIIHIQHVIAAGLGVEGIKKLQLVQKISGQIIVKYVCKKNFNKKKVERQLAQSLKLKDDPKITYNECNDIPPEPSGKFKMIKKETSDNL